MAHDPTYNLPGYRLTRPRKIYGIDNCSGLACDERDVPYTHGDLMGCELPEDVTHVIHLAGRTSVRASWIPENIGRFYRAEVAVADDLYVLGNRQLIKQWDVSGIDTSPRPMFVSRDSIYLGIHESSTECNLWRYYLPTGGLARDLINTHSSNTSAKINTITQSNGKFVTILSGIDVYIESSNYVDEGYIITSPADLLLPNLTASFS